MAATRKLTVEILGDAKGAMGAFGTVQKGTQNLGESFVQFGRKAALAFAGVAAGAIALGKSVVSAASDLNENLSKTQVVFGDAAQAIIDFSKTTAKSLGQSQNQTLSAAGTFGIFGKAAGLTGKDLSGFTTDLITLASDMASFSNTTPQEAIDALGAALRGESEPIRKYGVLLNDASLRAKAMELGIYDGNGALTAQQKILAANALIFEQTSDAQGDFARTSDGLANQQRILAARFEDIKTKIGTLLLPVVLDLVGAFGDFLDQIMPFVDKYGPKAAEFFGDIFGRVKEIASEIAERLQPYVQKTIEWMRDNTGTVKTFFTALAGAAAIAAVAAMAGTLAGLIDPITLLFGSLAVVAAGFQYAYQNSEDFRDIVDKITRWVRDVAVPRIIQAWQDHKDELYKVLVWLRDTAIPWIVDAYNAVKDVIEKVFNWITDTAIPWLVEAYEKFKVKLDEFEIKFREVHENIAIIVEKYVMIVAAYLFIWYQIYQTFGDNLQSLMGRIFSNIFQIIQNVLNGILGAIQVFAGLLSGDWSKMWDGLKTMANSALENIKGLIGLAVAPILGFFGAIYTGASALLGKLPENVKTIVDSMVARFQEGFSKISAFAWGVFTNILSVVKLMVSGAISYFVFAINTLIGLINVAIRAYNAIPIAPDISTIPSLSVPKLAEGGIVTKATLAVIGEAGPEAVVPLSPQYMPDFLNGGARGGDTVINIQVDAGLVSSPEVVGQQIIDAIRRAERRSGQVFVPA